MAYEITVIGGGFAGVEAAWAAATRGSRVTLYEMRPERGTPVHRTGDLAELVCSNSFKSNLLTNASGVLKEEMRRLGSLILPIAARHAVPAGEALAVDREPFAREVTAALERHPNVTVVRQEVCALPSARPLVVATGPLTSEALAESLKAVTGDALYFYDAVAPTVTLDSLDMTKLFRASRRGRGGQAPSAEGASPANDERPATDDRRRATDERTSSSADCDHAKWSTQHAGPTDTPTQRPDVRSPNAEHQTPSTECADYLNCPMTRQEYEAFWDELVRAEASIPHNPEDEKLVYFEACMPIEELARRGPKTLAYGPMKPIGLTDPRTGRRPWAVVQLRQENREGTLWGLVGFQTRLKWAEQKRILRMIPGLENAEFVRYGVIHRNTYVNAPALLDLSMQVRSHRGLFLAGQMTGVEGYLESAAIGMIAGLNAHRLARGLPPAVPPRETVLGSLCHYLVETDPERFAPMNSNWGIVPELPEPARDKREKARLKGERALAAFDRFVSFLESGSAR